MGMGTALLAGLGGAASGAAQAYTWEKEYQQKDRAITSREEMEKLRNDIRVMIAQIGADSRENVAGIGANSRESVAGIGATSRENVATITQGGANYRHDNASGDVREREAGSDRRLTRNIKFAEDKLQTDSADRRYGVDTRSRDSRYGVDVGASTARRGQDVTFDLGKRGQDLTAETTRRGQDTRSRDSRYSTDKRNTMFQGIFGPMPVTPVGAGSGVQVPDREREVPPLEPPVGTPITPSGAKPSVITPPAATPPVQPQSADAGGDKETQRRTRFEQIKREITQRKAKGQDISDLIKELQKLRAGGGL